MRRVSESPSIIASQHERHPLHRDAASCTAAGKRRILAQVAVLLWPKNTSGHLAKAAHLSKRAAAYFLAGGESEKAVRAIISKELE